MNKIIDKGFRSCRFASTIVKHPVQGGDYIFDFAWSHLGVDCGASGTIWDCSWSWGISRPPRPTFGKPGNSTLFQKPI